MAVPTLRIVHLSDLHATGRRHSWDFDGGLRRHRTESALKHRRLLGLLRDRRDELGSATVVITGDVTDRGDRTGHALATRFLHDVQRLGYAVHVVPGNHDWWWKGNRALDRAVTAGSLGFATPPGGRRARFHALARHRYPAAFDRPGGRLLLLDSLLGVRGVRPYGLFAQGRLGVDQLAWLEREVVSYAGARAGGGRLVVCLHHPPLRPAGRPVPGSRLERDRLGGLHDAEALLELIAGRVDAVLFGHSTPTGVHQQPRPGDGDAGDALFRWAADTYRVPVLHCVNLEHVEVRAGARFTVPVLDLGRGTVAHYDASAPDAPPVVQSLGTPAGTVRSAAAGPVPAGADATVLRMGAAG